jgi:hypothetical protein
LLVTIPTAVPLQIALGGAIGIGMVGLLLTAGLVGLALGAQPLRLMTCPLLPDRDAFQLGVAAGLFGAAAGAAATWLRTPVWAQVPDLGPLASASPILAIVIDPITGWMTRTAVILATFVTIERVTKGFTRHRAAAIAALAIIGMLAAGPPDGLHLRNWIFAALVTGAALPDVYVWLLRFDLTMVPLALGTMAVVGTLVRGMERPITGALAGSFAAAVVIGLLAIWSFRALRQWRATAASTPTP